MSGYVEHYPAPYNPVGPDGPTGHVVDVFHLRPGDQARLIEWAGGGIALADGGVLLVDGDTVLGRLALGDFAVRDGDTLTAEPADGFSPGRFIAAD